MRSLSKKAVLFNGKTACDGPAAMSLSLSPPLTPMGRHGINF